MEIIDRASLLPDRNIIENIIRNNPLNHNLSEHIDIVLVKEIIVNAKKEQSECIEYHKNGKKVILNIFRRTAQKDNFEFILYHEFGHVSDQTNSLFCYSDEKKESLTRKENYYVTHLWNLYIDSSLNRAGLGEPSQTHGKNSGIPKE